MNIGYVGAFWTAMVAHGWLAELLNGCYHLPDRERRRVPSSLPRVVSVPSKRHSPRGLTVAGVSSSVAIATALLYRLVTFYGRIPFGWLAMKYMEKKDLI